MTNDKIPFVINQREVPSKVALQTTTAPMALVQLTRRKRGLYAIIGVGLLGLLLLAAVLRPSGTGIGTHRQLGLPPCTFLTVFGVRCPSCGMTTSWSYFVRGQFGLAWSTNAGGACLAVLAALVGGWSMFVAVRGELRPSLRREYALAIGLVVWTVTLVDWVSRLLD